MITSAKYNMLYPPLVARIYEEERRNEKATKTRLHQMFGAYVQGNAHKKAAALLANLENGADVLEIVTAGLALHASTKERLPHLAEFCEFVSSHTGSVERLMDLGCGFNPFAVPFWPWQLKAYHAHDIDTRTSDLLNRFFALQGLPLFAACADLITETPPHKVELALMCKLIPVLEAQAAGRGFELARQLNAKFLVITYPLKSLGGREKGMGKNYTAQFERALDEGKLGQYKLVAGAEVGNELVYVLNLRTEGF